MDTTLLVRATLNSARTQLAEVFPRLTDGVIGWAPREGMPTIQRVLMDIGTTEEYITDGLRGLPGRSDEELDAPYLAAETVLGLVAKLQAVREATFEYIDGLDEMLLGAPALNCDVFARRLQIDRAPAAELLRYIARHESYHAGQLVSYLWAMGDDPNAWD